jgi:hypothetical protein
MIPLNAAAVSSILKEGMIILTRQGTNYAWYENIIYKCDRNSVYLALIDSYIDHAVMPGSQMTVKYANEFFEYLFEGTVSEIHLDAPRYISVKIIKAEEMINTRTFPRYDTAVPAKIRSSWSEADQYAIVTNVCLGGMAFLSKYSFDYGEECDVYIYLPGSVQVCARGKVIRRAEKNNFIDYSMQFTDMDESNNNLLSHYISSLEEKCSRMREQFYTEIKNLL